MFILKPLSGMMIYFAAYASLWPLNEVRIDVPGTSVSFAFGGIVQIIILIFGGIAVLRKGSRSFRAIRAVNYCFAIFVGWTLLSLIVNMGSIDPLRGFKELGRIVSVYFAFLVGYKYSKDAGDIQWFLAALFLSLIVPVAFGVSEIIHGTKFLKLEGYNRISGTLGIPNVFGAYIALPLLFLTTISLSRYSSILTKTFSAGGLVVLLIMLFFTYARASWLGFFVGLLFIGAKKYRRLLPYTIVICLIILAFFSLDELRMGATGSSGRLGLWLAFKSAGLKNLIFGTGMTSMSMVSKRLIGVANSGQNQYLLYLVEGGIFALLSFTAMLFFLYKYCSRSAAAYKDGLYGDFVLAYQAYLVCMIIIAFFESTLIFQTWLWLPAGIFCGIGLGRANKSSVPGNKNKEYRHVEYGT